MRLGGTEVIVANYQDFVDISRYWQRDPNIPYLPEYKSTWYISRPPIFRLKNRYFDDTLCISRVPQIPVVMKRLHQLILPVKPTILFFFANDLAFNMISFLVTTKPESRFSSIHFTSCSSSSGQ